MNRTRLFKGLWMGGIAFFISRCEIVEMCPFAVGFFVAVCLAGGNSFSVYIGSVLGLFTMLDLVQVVRYSVVMIFIAGLFNIKQLLVTQGKELGICFLSGTILSMTSLSFKILGITDYQWEYVLLEGALAFSVGMVYLYAIKILARDYARIATENEAAISSIVLGTTVLFGIPLTLPGGIIFAEAVALLGMLFVIYKFGFGIGCCWSMTTGFIMSYRTGVDDYFVAWILIGVVAQGLYCVLGGGRFGFGMYYGGLYFLIGTYMYPELVSEDGIKAITSALVIYLLAPRRLMLRVEEGVKEDVLSEHSSEWGRLVIDRINNLSRALKRVEYTMVGDTGTAIGFRDVGNIIEGFTNQLERVVPMRKTIASAIISELSTRNIKVKNLVLLKNQDERFEVYITAKVQKGKLVLASTVRDIVVRELGMEMEIKDESRNIVSRNYEIICFRQKPIYSCNVAIRRLSRYENDVSGDNVYVGDIMDGQKLIMLADGMGNGKEASGDSELLIDTIEELLMAGFDKETSIKIVNTYLSNRNKGERFSTLDMLIMDLHTGYGRMFKQGAAATFVKRSEWIEVIKSTSLPMGVIDGAVCESCKKKFYDKDTIVMVSDGVLESIVFENKEDYIKDMLINLKELEAEEIATAIVEELRGASGNRLKDDASIVVVKIKKNTTKAVKTL